MPRRADDFSSKTKRALADRVGHLCSNPECQAPTVGPSDEAPTALSRIGVACHIAAASSGQGARRHDRKMSSNERRSISNGVWLCENCAKRIDTDEARYPSDLLHKWRRDAEARAQHAIGRTRRATGGSEDEEPPPEFRVRAARVTRDDRGLAFGFAFTHDSPRALRDVQVSILLWRCSLSGGYTDVRSFTSANPLPRGDLLAATLGFTVSKSDVEPHFVIVSVSFDDSSSVTREQLFFYRWNGVQQSQPSLELSHASREERKIIDRRHDVFQQWLHQLPGSLPLSLYSVATLRDERQKVVASCFQDCASLLKREIVIPFHALARVEGYRLQSNDEVVAVCTKLEEQGFQHPLRVISDWVPENDWLDFLRHVQLSPNVNAEDGFDWLMEAETWRREHRYPKPPGMPLA